MQEQSKARAKELYFVCGGTSNKHELSLKSTISLLKEVDREKYVVKVLYISKDLQAMVVDGEHTDEESLQALKPQEPLLSVLASIPVQNSCMVLAGIHGEFVEDGKLQTLLEYFGLVYTGSGPAASALCMDKYRSSLVVATIPEVSLPFSHLVEDVDAVEFEKCTYPLICKPNAMGSSVGLQVAHTASEAKAFCKQLTQKYPSQAVLMQQYIQDGIELTCGFVETSKKTLLLPPIEIQPKLSTLFDYDSKYQKGGSLELCPPQSLIEKQWKHASLFAEKIHRLLGCRAYSRSDFIWKDDCLYYLETNTLPGMTATSLLPQELKVVGISMREFIDVLVEDAG